MAAKSASELVKNLKSNKEDKAKGIAAASIWPKCSHAGCPLPTTIKAETVTCTYHYREHGYNAQCITEAIKEFEGIIKKHNQMIFWNVREWKDKKAQIMGWPVLQATEQEMELPTLYIRRLKKWIDKSIVVKAEEIYKNGCTA